MAYVKQTFTDGTTVLTAAHMNHIEAGIVENENAIEELKSGSGTSVLKVKDGLTVAIIGDSISTHPQKNVAEIVVQSADVGVELSSYITLYDVDKTISLDGETSGYTITSDDVGKELTFKPCSADIGKKLGTPLNYNSITSVWWQVAADILGFEPIAATWSGSSITSHTAGSSGKEASYAWHDHTIRKLGKRVAGSMERIAPDVVLIYRGTNDLSHTSKVRLTEGYFDTVDWTYPETDLLSDGATYGYKEGLALTIQKIRETYPKARIVLCTCNVFKRSNYSHFPTHNGYFSIPQMNNAIREVADFFGCQTIELDKCGITFENCYSEGYITDSATTPTHPNAKGHALMAQQAICDLVSKLHICDIEPINPSSGDSSSGESAANYLVEGGACWSDGTVGTASGYFSYVDYPVEAGATYSIPYGRNYFFSDSSRTYISGGAGGGSSTLEVTIPSNAAYITVCWKYDDISVSEVSITKVGSSSGGSSSGSSDTSNYLAESTAVNSSTGTTYSASGYFSYIAYPVEAGATYSVPYGRNYGIFDESDALVKSGGLAGASNATLTIPEGATYLNICWSTADISTSDVTITKTTSGDTTTQTTIGDLKGTLLDGYGIASSTATDVSTLGASYFCYDDIAVEAGVTYSTPYARNTAYYQADGTWIKSSSPGGASTATLTTPDNCAYITVTYKHADVAPADVTITKA